MSFALSAAQMFVSLNPRRTSSRIQQKHREYDQRQLAPLGVACPA